MCFCASMETHKYIGELTATLKLAFITRYGAAPHVYFIVHRDACSSYFPCSTFQPLLSWCTFPVMSGMSALLYPYFGVSNL